MKIVVMSSCSAAYLPLAGSLVPTPFESVERLVHI